MTVGVWILGDQLWENQAALNHTDDKSSLPIILIECWQHVQQRRYHQQKLVLIWSAMRHFAKELRGGGWQVTYTKSEDFEAPLKAWIQAHNITEVRVMAPNDRPFLQIVQNLQLPCQITLIPNNHFLWTETEFKDWASSRKRLLMEDFYRASRQRFQVLMESSNKPVGGKWNFDKENRQPPKGKLDTPKPLWFEPDAITQEVIAQVKSLSFPTYGKIEPFRWAVTREQALQVLDNFIEQCLPAFGPYQDAMVTGEETMWHSLLSPYLNIGLLHPLEVIQAAETAYLEKNLNLNGVEGFIRQILGWREYIRGMYFYVDADYFEKNWFNHTQPLPEFFWDASKTDMNCLRQVLTQVEGSAWAHHIQRLMILSNFGLIAGISPQELEKWFHSAFVDAYDWVMQTNVLGMGLFADGGVLASKPYAASANYINKMSDYCRGCKFDRTVRSGENACPFNFFYWDFLARHREKLQSIGRMSFILANLDKMPPAELATIRQKAAEWHLGSQ